MTELPPRLSCRGVAVAVPGRVLCAGLDLDIRAGETWAVVGPNMAVTHGRFWFSAAFGIGIYHINYAPRLIWGVLF